MDSRIPEGLRVDYQRSIPTKLSSIRSLIDDLKKGKGQKEVAALRFFLHKLAGNAGVYGYMEVSRLCREASVKLVDSIEINTALLASLDQLYLQIQREFGQDLS